jgi:hypothetical protein
MLKFSMATLPAGASAVVAQLAMLTISSLGIERVQVDAGQQHGITIFPRLARRAHQHGLRAAIEMALGAVPSGGSAGAVDHDINLSSTATHQRAPDASEAVNRTLAMTSLLRAVCVKRLPGVLVALLEPFLRRS